MDQVIFRLDNILGPIINYQIKSETF